MVQKFSNAKNEFLKFYQRHEVLVSIAVFIAGFLFDILTLGRIDDLLNLIQQAVYLVILGSLLIVDVRVKVGLSVIPENYKKFWEYHDLVVHFLFGSLLSAYTIFYYTSASAITSFFFITLLAGLMLANEIPRIQKLGLPVRVILFCICVLSYFAFFYPILLGHVGAVPFWLGFISSAAVLGAIWKWNFTGSEGILKQHVLIPGAAVHLFFLLGYYFSLIPPVPVAVKRIGVYHEVKKESGHYIGKHQRPTLSLGTQNFKARPGDKVFILLSIFSPGRFEDKINLQWYFHYPKRGWKLENTIPLSILGGRDEGFRGFAFKQNYHPGEWRVIVETSDGREVGRISFNIEADTAIEERVFKEDVF